MKISELQEARLNPADFEKVMKAPDIHKARELALALLHSTTNIPKKRADMRDMVMSKGTKDGLLKLLWQWEQSLAGNPTGTPTTKGRKGLGYAE